MLDEQLKTQLSAYLERVQQPFELVASLDDSETARDMRELLTTIQSLRSDKITLRTDGNDARKPSFSLQRVGATNSLRFAGLPLGHEFTSLVLALLWTGGHPPKVEQDVIDSIKALDGDFNFEVYMSLTCHNCPDVVQALSLMAIVNPKIQTVVIEGGAFQQEVTERQIMAVPMVFMNGQVFASGRMSVEEIVAKLDTKSGEREAAKLNAKDAYDVLIVGGAIMGLAGAAQAHFIGFIAPDNYMPVLTFQVWAMLIVGGSGNNRGAIAGAILVWGLWALTAAAVSAFVPPEEQARAAALQIVAIGVGLCLMLLLRPRGLFAEVSPLARLSRNKQS